MASPIFDLKGLLSLLHEDRLQRVYPHVAHSLFVLSIGHDLSLDDDNPLFPGAAKLAECLDKIGVIPPDDVGDFSVGESD